MLNYENSASAEDSVCGIFVPYLRLVFFPGNGYHNKVMRIIKEEPL